MISNLTESMNLFYNQLSIRIDGLENNITQKIEMIIDKRIETAMRKERGNMQKDLDKMEKKMESNISKCRTDLKQDVHSVKKEFSDFKIRRLTQRPRVNHQSLYRGKIIKIMLSSEICRKVRMKTC